MLAANHIAATCNKKYRSYCDNSEKEWQWADLIISKFDKRRSITAIEQQSKKLTKQLGRQSTEGYWIDKGLPKEVFVTLYINM